MALDQETLNWIDEMKASGVSDAVIGALVNEAEKNEKIGNTLKGSVSATRDYKRKMDLVAKQQKDAEDLAKAHTAAMEELTKWKQNEVDPTIAKANAISTEMATLKTRISERAKLLKEKYGIDDAEVADLLDATKAVVKEVAREVNGTVDNDGRFKKLDDDFNKVSRAMPRLTARIEKIGRQFDRLYAGTGKEFDPEAMLDLAEKENLTLDAAFQKLYDVPARQTELANQAKEKEFADRLAKEKAAWAAQQETHSPGTTRPGEEGAYLTDVLNRHKGKEGEKKTEDAPNPMDRIRSAARPTAPAEAVNRYVSKFRQGEFKEKGISVTP